MVAVALGVKRRDLARSEAEREQARELRLALHAFGGDAQAERARIRACVEGRR